MEILGLIIILAIGLVSYYIKEREKEHEEVKNSHESKLRYFRQYNDVFVVNNKIISLCQDIFHYYPGSNLEKEIEMPFKIRVEEAFKIEATGYILDKIYIRTDWIIMSGNNERIKLLMTLKNNTGTTSIREVGKIFENEFDFNEELDDSKILDILKKFIEEKTNLV